MSRAHTHAPNKRVLSLVSLPLRLPWRMSRAKRTLTDLSLELPVTSSLGVFQAHMAWNPSGTHLAIGHSGSTLVDNWAATIVSKDGRKHGDMKLRSDRHSK